MIEKCGPSADRDFWSHQFNHTGIVSDIRNLQDVQIGHPISNHISSCKLTNATECTL